MISSFFLFLFISFVFSQETFDCAKLVCNPCRDKAVPADFVFIIDCSASMQDEIDTVKKGLQAMADQIIKEDVDPRYWVVLVGSTTSKPYKHELVIGGDRGISDSNELKREFGKIKAVSSVRGFQDYRGGTEATLEAIRMALSQAAWNVFDHKHVGGTGRIRFRADSKKFLISLTDEDSDSPIFANNAREFGFSTRPSGPTSSSFRSTSSTWAKELKATADALFNMQASIYAFTNPGSGQSKKQYGDPSCDVSNADFSNFDSQKTVDCLNRKGLGLSLNANLLSRDRLARTFNVRDVQKPGFIENFFQDAVKAVARCEMRKRQTPDLETCVSYKCDPKIGCFPEPRCADGCDQCDIDGKCYLREEQSPAKDCTFCLPEISRTKWSNCKGSPPNKPCKKYNCLAGFGYCGVENVCTVECNRCKINGNCYNHDWTNPANPCERCKPSESFSAWVDTCPKCEPACANGGICEGTTTKKCNCEGTGFEGPACADKPVCTPECKNGGVCKTGGVCECEGTGFEGPDCSKCLIDCEMEQMEEKKECTPACQNEGVCDQTTGLCSCAGTGFEGASCETPMAEITDPPTPSPLPMMKDPFKPTVDLIAICQKLCSDRCEGKAVTACACNAEGAVVNVECDGGPVMKQLPPECETSCNNACKNGYLNCDCDPNTGGMLVECKSVEAGLSEGSSSALSLSLIVSIIALVLQIK